MKQRQLYHRMCLSQSKRAPHFLLGVQARHAVNAAAAARPLPPPSRNGGDLPTSNSGPVAFSPDGKLSAISMGRDEARLVDLASEAFWRFVREMGALASGLSGTRNHID